MKSKIIIGVVITVLGVIGLVAATSGGSGIQDGANSQSSDTPFSQHLDGAVQKQTVDASGQEEVSVEINDFYYDATQLTITKGTTVTWTNQGNIRHDVTPAQNSPKQLMGSELLASGESYSYTFDKPGTYLYFCSPHPTQMRAVVIVTD